MNRRKSGTERRTELATDCTMTSLACTFSVSLVASALLTVLVRRISVYWGILDSPDGGRKCHTGRMPLCGGVAVYLAVILGLVWARHAGFGAGYELDELSAVVTAMAGFACFFGCVDDYCRLKPRLKLLLQTCAVLPLVLAGFRVYSVVLFGDTFDLGWLGIPLTIFWFLGCINAINLLDGMDGLASLVGLAAAMTLGVIAGYTGNGHVTAAAVVLAGALAGFLVHNRPPARIFLGDSGSMVIGVILGILGIQSTLKTSTTLSITAPLVVMTFPIFDAFLALVRRRLTGRPFDAADRQHIHHRLLDRGLGPWLVLAIIGTLSLATGLAALAATIVRSDLLAWATAISLVILVVRMRWFGYYEWKLATGRAGRVWAAMRNRWSRLRARRTRPMRRQLARLSATQVWAILVGRAKSWKVGRLRLILSRDGRPRWRRTWSDARRETEEHGWAVAVSVSRREGWTCELRAGGDGHAEAEFLSPAGLVRLLSAFASHFADHREQVIELADLESHDEAVARDGQENRCRAA
jgi:UDP-GlcNAc:undecaprenyl-phosphate GlcNAc-1-phosphate transferase